MVRDCDGCWATRLEHITAMARQESANAPDQAERIRILESELAEERRLNRQLTAKLLIDGVGDKHVASNTGKTGESAGS